MKPRKVTMARLCASILALLLAVATVTASSAEVSDASQARRIRLSDLCPDALPWTDHAPLPFPARRPRDDQGVPMIIVDGERHYRPGALAINGMKRLDAYRDTGDVRQLQQALLQADRLRELSLHRHRADWLPLWYDYPAAAQRAPWSSAMAQGLVLSFYVRLGRITGDPVHLMAARGIFRSFLREGRHRKPWVAYVDRSGSLWLNAHLHAIFGIYEYWQLTRSERARHVLRAAITTMQENAGRYRRPGSLSIYDLTHQTRFPKYHAAHVWQLGLLGRISGDRSFVRLARQLAVDRSPSAEAPGRPAKHDGGAIGPQCRPAGLGDMAATVTNP
jgi:hypothetical protein